MKTRWQTKTFGELCGFVRGPFGGSLKKSVFVEDGYAVYEQQHAIYNQFDDIRYFIDEAKFKEMIRFELLPNDLIMSCSGTMGRVAIVPNDIKRGIINQALLKLTPSKAILPEYLKHWMDSTDFQNSLKEQSGGAAVQNVASVSILKEISVTFPPLPEQQRIVKILDEAFEGIAIAKANAEKNLQNARAIFESYLNDVFTKKGEGWVEKRLGEVYDVRDGTHDSPKYHKTGFPLVTSKNLKREGLCFEGVNLINEQDYKKINQRSAVQKGDVLFAMIGTIGNPTQVMIEPNFAIKNVALFKIPDGQNGAFLKYYLASEWVTSKMMQEAKGTTQKFVGLGYLRSFPIKIPPLSRQFELVKKLDKLSGDTQQLEFIYEKKLAALDELKKSLLHKAFSGEL